MMKRSGRRKIKRAKAKRQEEKARRQSLVLWPGQSRGLGALALGAILAVGVIVVTPNINERVVSREEVDTSKTTTVAEGPPQSHSERDSMRVEDAAIASKLENASMAGTETGSHKVEDHHHVEVDMPVDMVYMSNESRGTYKPDIPMENLLLAMQTLEGGRYE